MKKLWNRVVAFFASTDSLLLFLCLALSGLSVVLLLGIRDAGFIRGRVVLVQAVATLLGLLVALAITWIGYDQLAALWKYYLPLVFILMLLTFTPLAVDFQGNRSWLNIGITNIQPSEFLKIGVILSLALHLSREKDNLNQPRVLLPILVHAFVPVLLIVLQKDLGVAVVMLFVVVTMIFMAGIGTKLVLAACGAVAVGAPALWFLFLSGYQKDRFLALADPAAYPDIIWQQLQGRIALASGGLSGIGIFKGDHRYVPESYNDFIFTFLGESMGLIGCLLVLLIYVVILGRILRIAVTTGDSLGKLVCFGVFAMLATQIVINVGMCLMLAPVVGITLPLLSAGGSSVLSVYAGVGLVLSVRTHGVRGMFTSR